MEGVTAQRDLFFSPFFGAAPDSAAPDASGAGDRSAMATQPMGAVEANVDGTGDDGGGVALAEEPGECSSESAVDVEVVDAEEEEEREENPRERKARRAPLACLDSSPNAR